jgi:hypothetical protein
MLLHLPTMNSSWALRLPHSIDILPIPSPSPPSPPSSRHSQGSRRPSSFQPFPSPHLLPVSPRQSPHPWLHVPPKFQYHIRPILQLPTNVRNLVFRPLIRQMQLPTWVQQMLICNSLALSFGCGLGLFRLLGQNGFLAGFGLCLGVHEVELVPGRGGGGEDSVPDDGFGGGFGGAGRGVDGFEVEEDLFVVPVEEGGEIYNTTCKQCTQSRLGKQ